MHLVICEDINSTDNNYWINKTIFSHNSSGYGIELGSIRKSVFVPKIVPTLAMEKVINTHHKNVNSLIPSSDT